MLASSFPKGNEQEELRILTQKPVYSPVTSICGREIVHQILHGYVKLPSDFALWTFFFGGSTCLNLSRFPFKTAKSLTLPFLHGSLGISEMLRIYLPLM